MYEFPHEFPSDLRHLRKSKLENFSKLSAGIAYLLPSRFKNTKIWQNFLKKEQNQLLNFP